WRAAVCANALVIGSGAWSKVSGPGTVTFGSASVNNTTATVSASGVYVLRWTISNGVCTASTDDVQITYDIAPTAASAGVNQNVCGLVVTLAGNAPVIGSGAWSKVSGPGTVTFGSASVNNTTATVSASGVYVLRWTISNGVCTASTDDVQITYDIAPTAASAGVNQNVCGLVVTLAGNAPVIGSGAWSKVSGPGTVTFGSASVNNTTATVSASGVYVLRWTISNGVCTASSDDVQITYDIAPTAASAGVNQNVCGLVATLAGNAPVIGSGAWSKVSGPGTVTFGSASVNNTTATVRASGVYVG